MVISQGVKPVSVVAELPAGLHLDCLDARVVQDSSSEDHPLAEIDAE